MKSKTPHPQQYEIEVIVRATLKMSGFSRQQAKESAMTLPVKDMLVRPGTDIQGFHVMGVESSLSLRRGR